MISRIGDNATSYIPPMASTEPDNLGGPDPSCFVLDQGFGYLAADDNCGSPHHYICQSCEFSLASIESCSASY